jgi:predicted alternative tryptophan synthase beta-subunit
MTEGRMRRVLTGLLGLCLLCAMGVAPAQEQPRRMSLAISGGASKGAYEAGLNWAALTNMRQTDEALECKKTGISKAILFNLCGHGYFDMQAYSDYTAGKLVDQNYDDSELAMALAGLPSVA